MFTRITSRIFQDGLIKLGCKLIMFDAAYRKKPTPTDEDVAKIVKSVITKPTSKKKRKSKIKPYAEWTEQERIAEFTRNRELIRSGRLHVSDDEADLSGFDLSKQKCLRNFADACFLIALFYEPYYYGDEDDIELLKVLDIFETTISKKSHEAIGYWTHKLPYVNSQGQNSLEVGQWTMNIAKDVLEKYGGIKDYDKVPRGKKVKVIEEIREAAQFKDERQVYKILNKLRNSKQT